jgi:hypothetical protein
MKLTVNQNDGLYTGDVALRVTALSYLKEALVKERYEECAELIVAAKDFGASTRDVRVTIARAVRGLKAGGRGTVPVKRTFRKRF